MQAEAASDELILATEWAEDVSLDRLEHELNVEQQVLQGHLAELQQLQVIVAAVDVTVGPCRCELWHL